MSKRHRSPWALPATSALAAALLLLGACQETAEATAATSPADVPQPQQQRLSTDQQDLLLKAISDCVRFVQASAPRQPRYKGKASFGPGSMPTMTRFLAGSLTTASRAGMFPSCLPSESAWWSTTGP